ncbi:hypothetical protein [Ramlibacter tataouinensis]|nr:hypothetical protein [Ramlibacter tataouinensis]
MMAVFSPGFWLVALVRLLPGPLLRPLDAWSHRVARRRAAARRGQPRK